MKRSSGLVLDLSHVGEGITTFSEGLDMAELGVSWPGLQFGKELQVSLVVARANHDLDVTVRFAGERQGNCDRCLKPYRHEFTGVVRALGRRMSAAHPLAGQDGVVFHDGRRLDLTGELRQAVLIDIPIRNLCSDNCPGLCPSCGADREVEPCGCAEDRADPRWEALRKAVGPG